MSATRSARNPADLVIERQIDDVLPELVWAAWTEPEHVARWFAPRPYSTTECEIDLRPGGVFRTVMRSPGGDRSEVVGCYLDVRPHHALTWTTALAPGFRPRPAGDPDSVGPPRFTATISLAPGGRGTRYEAVVMHATEAGAAAHRELGFDGGWNTALDQLIAVARELRAAGA